MKTTTRIVLGILFPFILILTVTTISKALKSDNKNYEIKPEKSVKNQPPTQNSSMGTVTLTKYSAD